MTNKFLLIALFFGVSTFSGRAGTVLGSQFKAKGELDGWTAPSGVADFGIAGEGFLCGTATNNDPQINHTKSITRGNQEAWGVLTVRLRQLGVDGKPVEFDESGTLVVFGKTVLSSAALVNPTGGMFVTLTYDLGPVKTKESGIIRFDPIGNTVSQKRSGRFEIDYIQVTTVPSSGN